MIYVWKTNKKTIIQKSKYSKSYNFETEYIYIYII